MKKYLLQSTSLCLMLISPLAFSSFKCTGNSGISLQDLPCTTTKTTSTPEINFHTSNPVYFFKKYSQLQQQLNTSITRLYSNHAKIHTVNIYSDKNIKNLFLTGRQWKKSIVTSFSSAKKNIEKSTFSNIRIKKINNKYRITANRYSKYKCYTDKTYFMEIRPHRTHGFIITKEHLKIQQHSSCNSQKTTIVS